MACSVRNGEEHKIAALVLAIMKRILQNEAKCACSARVVKPARAELDMAQYIRAAAAASLNERAENIISESSKCLKLKRYH